MRVARSSVLAIGIVTLLSLLARVQRLSAVEIREGRYEDRPQFIVRTETASYFFDRAGGGFSRLIDRDGRDWINFSKDPLRNYPASAAAGYRGIPNALFGTDNPDAGGGHPGFERCESDIFNKNTIRTVTKSGRWAWTWSFTETTATMTMEQADPNHAWWFLYEGPIAGSFAPQQKFWGTDKGGPRRNVPNRTSPLFDRSRWIYFGDIATPRVLFIAQHEADTLDDTVWYLGGSDGGAATASDGMMVFGFGRGPGTRPLFKGAGRHFSLGFLDTEAPPTVDESLHQTVSQHIDRVLQGRLSDLSPERSIHLYYGPEQRFGHLGEPQRWVNVLGNVTDVGALQSLHYALNDSSPRPLSVGTDLHRLALPGDFNVELAWDALRVGDNRVRLLATYADRERVSTDVNVHIERGNSWPLPYTIDFSKVKNPQDVVQVVDGKWHLAPDGVRTSQPWYDRVLALGDESWTNYEATVRLTLHGFTPPQRDAPTYNVTHMGVALRWRGHTADGRQPSRQWYPLGAQGEYLLKNDLSQNGYRILHHGGPGWKPTYGESAHPVRSNEPFLIKARVQTGEDGRVHYRFKQWMASDTEPAAWAVESSEALDTDLASGALCLVPHNADVTIHEVSVANLDPPTPWPTGVKQVAIPATADGSHQRALFWSAKDSEPRPLLVALHSWSGDYTQSSGTNYVTRCMARNWHFIHPDFRGVNRRPQATCSDFVVSDILDTVAYAQRNARVDDKRIYLVGASGGGMASLMALAKAAEVWTAVSAWVPISDLAAWHADTQARGLHYTEWIEASCNGAPGDSVAVDFQYWNRSPIHFLSRGRGVPLDLNAGIHDGHSGSVPIRHSLKAFNILAEPQDRIATEAIDAMVRDAAVPDKLAWQGNDPAYGSNRVLFRCTSGAARVTLFDGEHEINYDAAFSWLEGQGEE